MIVQKRPNLIQGVMGAAGLTMVAADAKGGKSVLCLEACRAVTTGSDFLGRFPVIQGPALYWQADDTNRERFITNYQSVLRSNGNKPLPRFEAMVKRLPLLGDGIVELEKRIVTTGAVLAVVDCLTSIRAARREDWVQQEYDELRALSDLGAKHKCCIALIHHLASGRRASESNPFIGTAGSFAVGGSVDGQIVLGLLTATRTERFVTLNGRDVDALRFIYGRDLDGSLFFVAGGELADQWEDAVRIFRAVGDVRLDGKMVGEATGVSDRQGRSKIAKLRYAGAVDELTERRFAWREDFRSVMERVININRHRSEVAA